MSVAPGAADAFVEYNRERSFGERRLALLYGRWVEPSGAALARGEKRGVSGFG